MKVVMLNAVKHLFELKGILRFTQNDKQLLNVDTL